MLKLKKLRSQNPSLSDLLPYATLASNGLVVTKRGMMLAGFYFRPPDSASTTNEMQQQISERVASATLMLGSGYSSWTDVVSVESSTYPAESQCFFPDPVSRGVDRERRKNFEKEGAHYENERVFIIGYLPPHHIVSKVEQLAYTNREDDGESDFAYLVESFDQLMHRFEDQCGRTIGLRRMQSYIVEDDFGRKHLQDELVNYFDYIVNGETRSRMLPSAGGYLDSVIGGGKELYPGERPLLNDEYISCVTISGFPAESHPNIAARLNTMGMPYRFSQRAIYMDTPHAVADLKVYKRQWGQKTKGVGAMLGLSNVPNNDYAVEMRNQCATGISLAESGMVRYLYYSAVVVLRHQDLQTLKEMERFVVRTMSDCGFDGRIETTNTVEAWRGSLPGDTVSNVRRPMMHTTNLSDMLPLSGVWTGDPVNPCALYPPNSPALLHAATIGNIPFRLNLHVYDVGHTLIFGPTGGGKSTLVALILMQFLRYKGAQIWAFDYKRGLYAATKACGGNHFDIGEHTVDSKPLFCPLGILESENDVIWAGDWIELCYELQKGEPMKPKQRREVRLALERLKKRPEHRSLSDFVQLCQDKDVKEAMEFYTLRGQAGTLLDAREDNITTSHFNVFETISLMQLQDRTKLPVLLYMFRRFERSLNGIDPSILLLDEAWVPLGNEYWRSKLREWLKLLRSKNCAVVMATQSLSDASRSGILDILVESCPTKIYLPNEEALKTGTSDSPGPNEMYRAMGLNENQISIIFNARRQREYYVVTPEGCRLIDLDIGPLALAFVGATSEKAASQIREEYVAKYGEGDWVIPYLKDKGVDHESYL